MITDVPVRRGDAVDEANVQLRGVSEQAWAMRPEVKLVEGRQFTPGLRELIVGDGAYRQFQGLTGGDGAALGIELEGVGRFDSGDAMESEICATDL